MRYYLALLLFCSKILGCASSQDLLPSEKSPERSTAIIEATVDGVSVVQIAIEPKHESPLNAFATFGTNVANVLNANFLREGISIRKVDSVDIPSIIASIGILLDDSYTWHGQILNWRELIQRQISSEGMCISSQGKSYFINGGFLSLLVRSWALESEDEMSMYLQFVPTWHLPRSHKTITGAVGLPINSKVFSPLQGEILLKDEEALILGCYLRPPEIQIGPQDAGPPPVRLGEALFGGPVQQELVLLLVIEANIMSRVERVEYDPYGLSN